MKKFAFILILLTGILTLPGYLYSQEYIGYHEEKIKTLMKEENKMFKLNTNTVNKYYKYLKYEDKVNEITIMFFLSDNDYCTLVRYMSDYSNINETLNDLNSKYKKISKNSWQYHKNGKTYSVKLEEGDWFFTVTTQEVK
jgi:hypothetical protein